MGKVLIIKGADFSANALVVNMTPTLNWISGYIKTDQPSGYLPSPLSIVAPLITNGSSPVRVYTTSSKYKYSVYFPNTGKWNNGSSSAAWINDNTEVVIPADTLYSIQLRYNQDETEQLPEEPFASSELVQNIMMIETT